VSIGKDPHLIQPTAKNRYSLPNILHAIQITPSETRWIKTAPPDPEPVDVVFWASCSGTNHPNVLLDTVAVLERLGLSYVTLGGGEICCGLSAIMRGDVNDVERLGREWVDNIAAFRPKKVVFLCQGCQARCNGAVPGLPSPLPFEYAWLPEFLVENLDKIRFTHPVHKVVTIHDSCGVTSLGTYDCTRELLRAIPGLRLVEMAHNRENNLCCGGVAAYYRPQAAAGMRHGALREAKAAGADVLATTCIGCNMVYLPLEDQYGLKVQNFMSLAAEGVGVYNEDKFRKYLHCKDSTELLAQARDYIAASEYSAEEMERILPATFEFLQAMGH
jgi:Fe-S oxidoreductase